MINGMNKEQQLIKAQERYIDYLAEELNRLARLTSNFLIQQSQEDWNKGAEMRKEIESLTKELKT